jgi:epoxide hydrolase
MDISPFKISVPQTDIEDLHSRLERTRWPGELDEVGWSRGVPLSYLKSLSEYWRTGYDWRKHEARLNEFPQFLTKIDGQPLHFLHVRSPEPDALPLLITHGWPGSIVEFLNIIKPLTNPRAHGADPADAFHLVIPSIPGFGFSKPMREKGWNLPRIGKAFAELMNGLGYKRYGAQGGDAGIGVSIELSHAAAQQVIGLHMNGPLTFAPDNAAQLPDLSEMDKIRLQRIKDFQTEGSGYSQILSTRPQTVAYGLADSPVAQLAWITEKFQEWTDPAAQLPEEAVDRDHLLTNVSLYWFTNTAASSSNLLYETAHTGGWPIPPNVPVGTAVFAGDNTIRRFTQSSADTSAHWSEFERGGHFAAMEVPDLLVGDVRKFFRSLRNG